MSLVTRLGPEYSPKLFVDRDPHLDLVGGLVKDLINNLPPRRARSGPRAVVFRGERGSGKTWLSLHLHRTILRGNPAVRSLLIRFRPHSAGAEFQEDELPVDIPESLAMTENVQAFEEAYETWLRGILSWVAGKLDVTTIAGAPLRDLTSWLTRDIDKAFQTRALVLMLDSIFELDWKVLPDLEKYLLAPLAALPCVLIIMTGRGKLYPWESPDLRVEVETKDLDPFDVTLVRRQLHEQAPEAERWAEQIYEAGGGQPLSTILIADQLNHSHDIRPEMYDKVIEALLSVVGTERYQQLRPYFEALCLLDGFRVEEIQRMVPAYYDAVKAPYANLQSRQIRDELVETHFVRWEKGQFVIDQPVRRALQGYLHARPDIERALHTSARNMYVAWAREYKENPQVRQYYSKKAADHASALKKLSR